jgi:hypothetical protein
MLKEGITASEIDTVLLRKSNYTDLLAEIRNTLALPEYRNAKLHDIQYQHSYSLFSEVCSALLIFTGTGATGSAPLE